MVEYLNFVKGEVYSVHTQKELFVGEFVNFRYSANRRLMLGFISENLYKQVCSEEVKSFHKVQSEKEPKPLEKPEMKSFVATYNSKENLFSGKIAITAETIADAQTKFFDWLKGQDVYYHMWRLEVSFEEIGGVLE